VFGFRAGDAPLCGYITIGDVAVFAGLTGEIVSELAGFGLGAGDYFGKDSFGHSAANMRRLPYGFKGCGGGFV
jgi:hypothetical protein